MAAMGNSGQSQDLRLSIQEACWRPGYRWLQVKDGGTAALTGASAAAIWAGVPS
jgi:hypothetical protein